MRSSVKKMLQRHAGQTQGNLSGREVQADLLDRAVLELALAAEDSGVEDALTSVVAVFEELGRYRVAEPFVSKFLGARLLAPAIAGRTEEIDRCLSTPATVAIYEPGSRYSFEAPSTEAQARETGYSLKGTKVAVSTSGAPRT